MTPDGSTTAALMPAVGRQTRLTRPRLTKRLMLMIGIPSALVVLIGGAVLLLSGGGAPAEKKAAGPVLTVAVVPVERTTMAETLLVNGSLTPWQDQTIGSEAGGLAITQIVADEGDWVKAGQVLAKLDDSLLQAQLKQVDAQIARAQATQRLAESDVKRGQELLKTNAISIQTAEQRDAAAAQARADVALASAQRTAILAQLAQTEIKAPTDGLIAQRTAVLGKVVNPGDLLFHEVRDGILELDAEIPDRLLARVQAGQTVHIRVGDGADVSGAIRLVAPLVDTSSRNGIAHVRFPLDPKLRAGMFVSGELVLGEAPTLAVPEAAIIVKDGHPYVFVLADDGKAVLKPVDTGQRAGGKVAIRKGITEADKVVTKGAGFLRDGDPVRVGDS